MRGEIIIDRTHGSPDWSTAPVSEAERIVTARRISAARVDGRIIEPQERLRLGRVSSARTRADLAAAVDGIPGVAVPPPLLALSRAAMLVWVLGSAVQLVVWLVIYLISGDSGDWWWIWTPLGGAPVAAALWWTFEWRHRPRNRDHE